MDLPPLGMSGGWPTLHPRSPAFFEISGSVPVGHNDFFGKGNKTYYFYFVVSTNFKWASAPRITDVEPEGAGPGVRIPIPAFRPEVIMETI